MYRYFDMIRNPALSIRSTLLIVLAILNLIIAVVLGVGMYRAIANYVGTAHLQKATEFVNELYVAEKHLAQERSWSVAAFYLRDEKAGASLITSREAVDKDLDDAVALLSGKDKANVALSLEKIVSDRAKLQEVRAQLDAILAKDTKKARRDAAEDTKAADRIVAATTNLINNIHILIDEYSRPLMGINVAIARQMRFSTVVFEITEYASREYTLLGQLIAENRYPDDETREQLALWRGRINYGWDIIHAYILSNTWAASANESMDTAESNYFETFDHIKQIFNKNGDKRGPEYPLTLEMWLAIASQAVDSLYDMNEAVLTMGNDYKAEIKRDALWEIIVSLLLFICTMGVSLYLWRQIILRVVRPVDSMVSMLYRATEGEYATDLPKFSHYPEEIKKLAKVLGVLQENAKQLQEERDKAHAASIAKSDFITNMSHELRTPMNVVLGLSEILSRTEPLTEQQREFVNTLKSSGKTLLALINDLLDLSTIESGASELGARPFDLHEIANDMHKYMSVGAVDRGIKTKLTLSGIKGKSYIGDSTKIRQIILNLYGNALKFTEKGEVALIIKATPGESGREDIQLELSDTGIGIPEDKLEVVFDKFTQVDTSLTRKYGGTGLGLAITKSLVEMMDGTIIVRSLMGRGTVFTVTFSLPVEQDEAKMAS